MTNYSKYFPHFSNLRNDRRIKKLVRRHGWEGYAFYLVIMVILFDRPGIRIPVTDIPHIAYQLKIDRETVEDIIHNYDLFQADNEAIYVTEMPHENLKINRK